MIERLLAAEEALAEGRLDAAEKLFGQIATGDPRNAIALVGLAHVAARRGARDDARELVRRALELDPEEAAAARLLVDLEAPAAPAAAADAPTPEARPSFVSRLRAWLARLLGGGR